MYEKINERIKEMRIQNNFTLKEVATRLHVAEATAQRWESGDIHTIKQKHIAALAKMFGCTPEYLSGWIDNHKQASEYPIIGRIPAGTPLLAIKDYDGTVDIPMHIVKRYGATNLFALRVSGCSMNKVIADNAIGIFVATDQANNGDIVAVTINGDDATLKRFIQLENFVILKPESYDESFEIKTYDMIEEPNFRIIGRLIAGLMIFE